METLIVLFMLIIGIPILINIFSSSETKLLRRIWSSEKFSNFDAQRKAYEELLRLHQIEIANSNDASFKNDLEEKMMALIGKAVEFDVKNPRNSGIRVVAVLVRLLRNQLNAVGISDFDENLNNVQNVDYAAMSQAVKRSFD